jgi:hypothetical protein
MSEFYYQIKGKCSDSELSYNFGNWSWPPIFSGMVVADTKKLAHIEVNEQYGKKFPLRVLSKDLDSNEFLLHLREIKESDHHTRRLFEVQTCKQCGEQFTVIEKYEQCHGGSFDFCSKACSDKYNHVEYINRDGLPVIYRITNKLTNMCYIGKTRQSFTLRWWQHITNPGECKFHMALRNAQITDWTFEVIEIVTMPEGVRDFSILESIICERESEHIRLHNSIEDGYNTRQ